MREISKVLEKIIYKLGWRHLKGYGENYYVNPHDGYICSVQRRTGKLKPLGYNVKPNKEGYINVKLKDLDGKFRSKRVNRLVLGAYYPCPGENYVSHHCNNNKTDNRLINLQWLPHRENIILGMRAAKERKDAIYTHNQIRKTSNK